MFSTSLKKEILALMLGLTIITIVATATIGISSIQIAGRDASGASSGILRTQAQTFLTQIATAAAQQQDLLFEKIKDNTNVIASFTASVYGNPELFTDSTYWHFDNRITRKDGRYLNSASDVSTVHIPSFVDLNETEKHSIERSANLDFLVPDLLKNSPDSVAAYTIDTKGVTRYFPNIVLGSLAPPDYDPRSDIYYKPATPAENPDKKVVWSPLYDDVAGRGLMITVTAPIYSKSHFVGIAATDVLLINIINTITAYRPAEEGSYAFLVDKNAETIAFPDKAYQDILGRSRQVGEVRTNLATTTSADFATLLKGMTNGEEGFGSIHSGERELFIAYAPLKQTGFSMAVVADAAVILKAAGTLNIKISDSVQNNVATRLLPASALILLVAAIIGILQVARIVKPVQELTLGAHEIAKGNFDYKIKTRSKNEIGELSVSFNQMGQALKKSQQEILEYSQGLEKKVAERTQELSSANERQEGLIHFIGHEVKGFLTKAEGAFAALGEGDFGTLPVELKPFVAEALKETRNGVTSVSDILKAANQKKGTITYEKAPLDLRVLVIEAVEKARPVAERKKLGFELFTYESQSYPFIGDKVQIADHVLRNLIDNAIAYTPKGSVEVSLKKENSKYLFSVKDSGVGVSREDRAHLFTEGGHGKDSQKVNVHSTGYGLFIAKNVVEAHGGNIRVESEGSGHGSTFVVELPV
ncbi:MAG: ATP-binding protein [bacterium]|nr:ATP-binding protein [bacterium]